MGSVRDVLLSSSITGFVESFSRYNSRYRQSVASINIKAQYPRYLIEGISLLVIILLAFIPVLTGENFNTQLPSLGAIILGSYRLLQPLQQCYNSLGLFKANSASIQKVSSHLKLKKFVPAKSLKYLDSNNESILISFKNVSYCYPKSKEQALVNVNLNINKGERVAFVGMSGSGKSTCADLMTGLITSQTGQVFISKDYSSQNEEVKGNGQNELH